ncbi:MAG: metallophosphoesterase family protein [bacterium]|nr:metallophosphoesterase family protein [bacterium]
MIERVAVLADIHGNRLALEAVLRDIRGRGVEHIVNLGDSLYGPLDPAGTADILMALGAPTVCGNQDRVLIESPPNAAAHASLDFTLGRLTDMHLAWLSSLESIAVAYDDLFLCHGSPTRDDQYLLVEVEPDGLIPKSSEQLQSELSSNPQSVVVCGHDHTPRTITLPDGRLIVNPGSVGLQAYTDDSPYPHVMQAGSPHARYCVLSRTDDIWQPEPVEVVYDWNAAAELAGVNGREDWVPWLLTGLAE